MTTLVANDLDLRAGKRVLVEKLDWTVGAGQCWFVYGRNGAGRDVGIV